MKHLMLLASLLSAPAYATNVLYSPVPDPITQAPSLMYLTNTHSRVCSGKWYRATINNSATGKQSSTQEICWGFGDVGSNGWTIWIPSTGFLQEDVTGFGPVPGAGAEWIQLLKTEQVRMSQEAQNQINAFKQAQPHP